MLLAALKGQRSAANALASDFPSFEVCFSCAPALRGMRTFFFMVPVSSESEAAPWNSLKKKTRMWKKGLPKTPQRMPHQQIPPPRSLVLQLKPLLPRGVSGGHGSDTRSS